MQQRFHGFINFSLFLSNIYRSWFTTFSSGSFLTAGTGTAGSTVLEDVLPVALDKFESYVSNKKAPSKTYCHRKKLNGPHVNINSNSPKHRGEMESKQIIINNEISFKNSFTGNNERYLAELFCMGRSGTTTSLPSQPRFSPADFCES